MLKYIKLINWTSHALTQLEFAKGVNLFVGVMGSGKTSVLEAISYALFGDFPEGVRKRKLKDIIRHNSQKAEVELLFEFKGNEYVVRRTIKPKNTDAVLLVNGKIAERGTKRVSEFIERILNVNYQTFSRIVFAPQNELDNLLLLSPAERKRTMDKLMGIYDMQMVGEKAQSLVRKLKHIEATLTSSIDEEELEKKKKKFEELSKKEGEIKKALKQLSEELEVLNKRLEEINTRYEILRKQKEEYDVLRREEAKILGILSNLSDVEEVSKEDLHSLEEELNEVRVERDKKEEEIKKLEKERREIEAKIRVVNENIRRKNKLLQELQRLKDSIKELPDIESFEKELDLLNEKLVSFNSKHKRAEESLEELKKAGARCPVCLSPLTEERKNGLIEDWLLKKEEAEKAIKQINQKIKDLKERVRELRLEEKKQISVRSRLQLIEKEIEKIKLEDINELMKKREAIEERLKDIREGLRKLEEKFNRINLQLYSKRKELDMYVKKKKAEGRLSVVREQLKRLEFNEEEFDKVLKIKGEIDVKLSSLKERINSMNKELRLLSSMKGDIENEIKTVEVQIKKLNKIKTLKQDLVVFSDVVNELQYIIRNELLEALNKLLPEIWNAIYPYADYKSIRIEATKDTYKFYAYLNSRWVDLSSYASGGERMAFAIALRIALTSLLVPDLGLLILDEPTHNLDENAINKLISLIEEKLPLLIEQTFIITHDERLKSPLASTLYLFKRKKEGNDPTVVEKLNNR